MKKYTSLIIISFLFILPFSKVESQVTLEQTTVDTSTVISGLDVPWEMLWGPDNMLWVTERFGRVSRINPQTGTQHVILDYSSVVEQSGESGMLGMKLHPHFADTPYVYIAYTYLNLGNLTERVSRFEYDGSQLVNESVLIDGIPGNVNHDGCRLLYANNKLFITTGDALNQAAPQDLQSLNGKILRINPDGSIPDDNPFPGSPVWSFGHRNPQGLMQAPNDTIYSSEHGPSNDDEVNIIDKGRNYGWPDVQGFCNLPAEITFCQAHDVKEPLVAWTPTIAPADIVWYDSPAIPEWDGSILLVTLKNKRIYELEMNATGSAVDNVKEWFNNYWGRLRDICISPDGSIYLATNGPLSNDTEPFTHKIIHVWNPNYQGTGDFQNKAHALISPNPVKSTSRVLTGREIQNGEYFLYNASGMKVNAGYFKGKEFFIRNDHYAPGLYLLMIRGDNYLSESKIIME